MHSLHVSAHPLTTSWRAEGGWRGLARRQGPKVSQAPAARDPQRTRSSPPPPRPSKVMTNMRPKTYFLRPDVAIPLGFALVREIWNQKVGGHSRAAALRRGVWECLCVAPLHSELGHAGTPLPAGRRLHDESAFAWRLSRWLQVMKRPSAYVMPPEAAAK